MTTAALPQPTGHGELRFIEAKSLPQLRGAAAAAAMIYVEIPQPSLSFRGQLGDLIEAMVEEELTRVGVPCTTNIPSPFPAMISDQLARIHAVGMRGLVLALESLAEIAGVSRILDPDDSSTLRYWASATRSLPITLLLDQRDLGLAGHTDPQRLDTLLGWTPSKRPRPEKTIEQSETQRIAEELHAARGPKPLGVIERLFLTRYVPLAEAELQGKLEPFARQVLTEWIANFSRSYTEAFQALKVTGKRPAMVFDVPQIATRIARLHGARSVELLLVDGMRYDLGQRVQERLVRSFDGRATCVDTMLLWSALPSTTPTQLDLLTHGLEALNRPIIMEDPDTPDVARERLIDVPRRIRVGQRDLARIDVVEARLREVGPPLPGRLDQIAEEVARSVLRHAETLPERTLLIVFGDHGFVVDATVSGSGIARQGGASPEEVLVPGFAWLLNGSP